MPLGVPPIFLQQDQPAPPTPHNPQDTIKIPMFWPGDDDVVFPLNSHQYPFKANSIGLVGPQMKHQEDEQTGKLQFHKPLVPIPLVGAADQVATELKKMYEEQGLTLLYNDGFDEQRKIAGREANVKYRMGECTRIVASHQAACSAAMSSGRAAPPANLAYRKALAFVNFYDQQLHSRERYICQMDGADFKSLAEFRTYVASNYPAYAGDAKILFDSHPHLAHVEGDLSTVPEILSVKAEIRTPAPAPIAAPEPEIPAGDLKMTLLKKKANEILVEAAINQITLDKEVIDILHKGTDSALIEAAIDEATITIHGPALAP